MTQEQKLHGLSVDNQIQALTDFCAQNGYEIYKIYNDAGISAHASYKKRPELLNLIRDCQNKKVDVILFTRLDRWFRSIKDYFLVQDQIGGVPWRATWEDYNTETSDGVFKVNIMLSISEAEASRTAEKVKSVLQYKREQGMYVGSAPLGYKIENSRLVIDPDTEPYVRAFFDTYLETHLSSRAIDIVKDMGYKMSKSGASSMLRNRTYTGDAQGCKCPAYITEAQFKAICETRRRYVRSTKQTRVHLFSGLVICADCGGRMRASFTTKGNPNKEFTSYRCDPRRRTFSNHAYGISVGEIKVEKYLLAELDNIIADMKYEYETSPMSDRMEEYQKEKKRIEDKLERIKFLYMEGDLSMEEYKEKKNELIGKLNMLSEPAECPNIELPADWKEMYGELSREGKRAFWYQILKEIRYSKAKGFEIIFLAN